ncbi:hypothetical protein FWD20_00640 [Candidatus Saccharibacteria bacterium]|nr:hypothetical protein [Candidatus Saccharibacteria bacterium]
MLKEFGVDSSIDGEDRKLNPFTYYTAMLGPIFDGTREDLRLIPATGEIFRSAWKMFCEWTRNHYETGDGSWFAKSPPHSYVEPENIHDNPYKNHLKSKQPFDEIFPCELSPERELTYTYDLGRHRRKIADFIKHFYGQLNTKFKFGKLVLPEGGLVDFVLKQVEHKPIDESTWSTADVSNLVQADRMRNVLHDTNMENSLIRAVEALADLIRATQILSDPTERDKFNNPVVFREVMLAQEVLAHLAESQGFDALFIALDGMAKEIRLTFGTHTDRRCLELARRIKKDLPGAENINSAVESVLEELSGSTAATNPLIKSDESPSRITYGEGWIEGSAGDSNRVRYRIKSDGSLGWKIKQYVKKEADKTGKTPEKILDEIENSPDITTLIMDIVGVTVMAQDESDQHVIFGRMVGNLLEAQSIDPSRYRSKPAPSRKQAIQIRGTKKFTEDFSTHLSKIGLSEETIQGMIEFKWGEGEGEKFIEYTNDDVHVAKITFIYTRDDGVELPMEIQCVTEDYRTAMRDGKIAHWLFKAGHKASSNISRLVAAIKELTKRKKHMGRPDSVSVRSAHESWRQRLEVEHFGETSVGEAAVAATDAAPRRRRGKI